MSFLPSANHLPTNIDPKIRSILLKHQQQLLSAIKQLERLDLDIANRKDTMQAIRDQLFQDIQGLDETSEIVQILQERIRIADAFLNVPNERMEIAIAREYLEALFRNGSSEGQEYHAS